MAKKEKNAIRLDRDGVQKVMRIRDYFGDSLGMFALNIITGLIGQLTYYYTDKVGLAAGAIATSFMILKVFDAFTDIIMGNIIDNTKPGKERYRPWYLKAGIPAGILVALMFAVPKGSSGMQLAYVIVTNFLLTAVLYTAMGAAYSSILMVRTNSQEERGYMGTWRAAAGYISGMFIAILVIPISNMLGGTQSAWIKMGTIFGAILILAMLICYLTSRETAIAVGKGENPEQKEKEEEEKISIMEAIGKLFANKYWVIVLILNFAAQVSYGLVNTSGTYYCKWIYGNDNLVALLGGVGLIPTFLGFILVGPMMKRFGAVKSLKISFILGIAANALRIINPYNLTYNIVMGCVATFANIPMMCLGGVLGAMTVEYNEYKYGLKMIARSGSAIGFGQKVASGFGASLVGWCLAAVGYSEKTESARIAAGSMVSMGTRQAIFTFSIYIPLILYVIMLIAIMKFDLDGRIGEIREAIAKRKETENGNH
ncbi:putative glycoside/cation symporter YagG [Lachnospiraceae bacterium]|nr:putative glycoside/cation symporter YagG [Lachnospiraceae bacterium]GFI68504.1 putative glycoside/cation symporter YagG [Lachnospiraceae bacterium]